MKFEFMKNHANEFKIGKMALVLQVSRKGYYKHLRRNQAKKIINARLLRIIRVIYRENRELYGSPRIHGELVKIGERCSRKKVAKLMRKNGIQSKIRKQWKVTTKSSKDLTKIAPNLLEQNFTTEAPNLVWVSDITYIKTREGWLYLAVTMDLFSRKIVGFSTSKRIDANLVVRALEQAICHRMPAPGLIHHSDRGVQYTSNEFRDFAKKCGIRLSMSGKGNCYDNAAMESFFHTLKTEHVAFCNFITRAEATASIFEYIEVFYNRERTHSTLKYVSPLQFEQRYLISGQSRMKLAQPAIEAIINF